MYPHPETLAEFAIERECDRANQRLRDAHVGCGDWTELSRPEQFDRLATLVGDTDLVDTGYRFNEGISNLYTKQEYGNISGSHYDRAFLSTIRSFEETGLIRPGDELRDITSGSGGISLAVMAQVLGYAARITVPSELPHNRVFPMRFFGAEVIDAGPGYMQQASNFQVAEIRALKADPSWTLRRPVDRNQRAFLFEDDQDRICYLNHSENTLSPQAFKTIGYELIQKLARPPFAVLLAMGNWTTIAGIAPVLRGEWPETHLVGYEGENTKLHDNFGTSVDNIPLRFRDESLLDELIVVTNDERDVVDNEFNTGRSLIHQLGHSSLMGLAAAINHLGPNATGDIVTIAYDQKLRY